MITQRRLEKELDISINCIKEFFEKYKEYPGQSVYENWNCCDTLAHISFWLGHSYNKLNFAINKIAQAEPEERNTSLESINQDIFEKNKKRKPEEVLNKLLEVFVNYKKIITPYSDDDINKKGLFEEIGIELWKYAIFFAVLHPVMHIAHHHIKTKNYKDSLAILNSRKGILLLFSNGANTVFSFKKFVENKDEFIKNLEEIRKLYGTDPMAKILYNENKA